MSFLRGWGRGGVGNVFGYIKLNISYKLSIDGGDVYAQNLLHEKMVFDSPHEVVEYMSELLTHSVMFRTYILHTFRKTLSDMPFFIIKTIRLN